MNSRQVIEISCQHCGYKSPITVMGSVFSVEFINKWSDEMENADAEKEFNLRRAVTLGMNTRSILVL